MDIQTIAFKTRSKFENRKVDGSLLKELYLQYSIVENIDLFIEKALQMFPKLNCGLASIYLNYLYPQSKIVRGTYKNKPHG